MPTLREFAANPQLGEEHVEMEAEFFGNPNVVIITNSTDDWYYETFVDVRTARQFDSRDHGMVAS